MLALHAVGMKHHPIVYSLQDDNGIVIHVETYHRPRPLSWGVISASHRVEKCPCDVFLCVAVIKG